jgi:hypothetical protein
LGGRLKCKAGDDWHITEKSIPIPLVDLISAGPYGASNMKLYAVPCDDD